MPKTARANRSANRSTPTKKLHTVKKRSDGERRIRDDGFVNPVAGYGMPGDKLTAGFFQRTKALDKKEIEGMYHFNAICGRYVDGRCDEMFRLDPCITIKSDEENTAVKNRNEGLEEKLRSAGDDLGIIRQAEEAYRLARMTGGAAMVLFVDDIKSDMSMPLAPLGKKSTGTVVSTLTFNAWQAPVLEYYSRQTAQQENLPPRVIGTPRLLQATGDDGYSLKVHVSRTIRFFGSYCTPTMRRRLNGWGLSVLDRPYEIIRDFCTAYQAAGGLLADMSQAVFKMKGLWDAILKGKGDKVKQRMEAVDRQRSSIKAIVIDAEEEFARISSQIQGVAELLGEYKFLLGLAFDEPLTRLFGMSPGGLNSSGDSDTRDWYDSIASEQRKIIIPLMRVIYARIGAPLGLNPSSIKVEFPPLYEMTPKEKAEIEYMQAQTANIYDTIGSLDALEIRAHLAGRSWESMLDADQALRELASIDRVAEAEAAKKLVVANPAKPVPGAPVAAE